MPSKPSRKTGFAEAPQAAFEAAAPSDLTGDPELLRALTEADTASLGPKVWTPWRECLVETLTARTREVLPRATAERTPGQAR